MTFLSRILGYARDMVAAHQFGASPAYDAFVIAFKIPNFLRRLFAEGAFSQAFVPVLSEYRCQQSQTEVQRFINLITGHLALVLIGVTVIAVLAAPLFVYVFAPGFGATDPRFGLAEDMLRITFPYLFFISLTALSGGILNTFEKFAAPAFTPTLLNISMIIAMLFFAKDFSRPEVVLAWGVFFGGVLQLSFQIPFLLKIGYLPIPRLNWKDPGVKKVLTLMAPAVVGASVSQINALIDTLFASFLPSGSVTWLYYADRLLEFPLGIFGVSLATVILPNLSRQHAKSSNREYSAILDWGLRAVLLLGVPSMLGLFVMAGPLVVTLFQNGEYSALDAQMSTQALMAYSAAVLGIMAAKVLASGFFAKQDIKTPVKVSVVILAVNLTLNSLLIGPMAHAGLALATSVASWVHAGLLYMLLIKRHQYAPTSGWTIFLLRLGAASIVMVLFLYLVLPGIEQWLDWHFSQRILRLLGLVAGAASLYFCTLLALGFRPRQVLMRVS